MMTFDERAKVIIAALTSLADRTPDPMDRVSLSAAVQFIKDVCPAPQFAADAHVVSLEKNRLDAAYAAYWDNCSGTYTSIECAILSYLNSGAK